MFAANYFIMTFTHEEIFKFKIAEKYTVNIVFSLSKVKVRPKMNKQL